MNFPDYVSKSSRQSSPNYLRNTAEVDNYIERLTAWAEEHMQKEAAKEPPAVVKRLRMLQQKQDTAVIESTAKQAKL
jgi:hypothetical protein